MVQYCGHKFRTKSSAANTGATTLTLTLGSTVLSSTPIVKGNNTALSGGEIPAAGYPLSLTYSSTFGAWVLTDPTIILSAYALVNSQTFTGTPRVPTAPFNDNSTIIANTAWVENQLANYAPIFSPILTGVPAAPTASLGTQTTQLATTSFANPANSIAGNGYQKLPSGLIIQWMQVTSFTSTNFPIAFPNAVFVAQATGVNANTTVNVTSLSTSSVTATVYNPGSGSPYNGVSVYIFAIGY